MGGVQAFDQDVLSDDFLGDASTDAEGRFEIRFSDADFKDALETRPDIYLVVRSPDDGRVVLDTSYEVRRNASDDEIYELRAPAWNSPGSRPAG